MRDKLQVALSVAALAIFLAVIAPAFFQLGYGGVVSGASFAEQNDSGTALPPQASPQASSASSAAFLAFGILVIMALVAAYWRSTDSA